MIQFIKKYSIYLVLFLIAIAFIFPYLKNGFILASGESQLYLNPTYINHYFMWTDKINFGSYYYGQNNIVLFSLLWELLKIFSFTIHASVLFIFLSFFLPSITFIFCVDKILKLENKLYYLPTSILYSYNVFRILAPLNERLNILFIFLPLFFFYFYELLITKKWNNVFILGLLSFFSSSMGGNLPIFTIPYLTMFLMFMTYIFLTKSNSKEILLKLFMQILVTLLLFLLINLFWLLPLYKSLLLIFKNSQDGASLFTALASGDFYDHFRLIGSWAWKQSYNISLYYVFSESYYRFPMLVSTYLIVLTSFLYIFNLKKNLLKTIVLFISLTSLLLLAGTKGPLGFVYQFFYDNILLFKIYREPFTKFTPILIFGMSFGLIYSMKYIKQIIKKTNIYLLITFLTFLILFNAYPLFNTEAMPIRKWNAGQSSTASIVPEYWKQAKQYIDNDKTVSNYLLFPWFDYGTSNNWIYGINVVGNVADYLIDKGNIRAWSPDNSNSGKVIKNIVNDKKNTYNLSKYLGLLNTKFILQENDMEWRYSQTSDFPPSKSNVYLKSHKLQKVAEFGKLDLDYLQKIPNKEPNNKLRNIFYTELENKPALVIYKINDSDFYPIIYSPQKLILSTQKIDKLLKIVSDPKFINAAVFFNYQVGNKKLLDKELFKHKNTLSIITEFNKISSTKYEVILHQTRGTIPLVFSQTFHTDWKLYPVKNTINTWFKESLSEENHYIANGFANSWIINVDKLCANSKENLCTKNPQGGYDIDLIIEFWPQRIFILSFVISITSTLLCLIVVIYLKLKEFLNKTSEQQK